MPNENTRKPKSNSARNRSNATNAVNKQSPMNSQASKPQEARPQKQTFTPKEIDPNQIVTVRNGFQGRLVYRSRHTGEPFVWDSFGAEQDMELCELKRARSSNKKYFINNWFMFDEPWIIDYLGMGKFYKTIVNIDDFDKLFELPADEIGPAISELSDGQKKSIAYRARQLISENEIDSNKTIAALEEALGVELVDRF